MKIVYKTIYLKPEMGSGIKTGKQVHTVKMAEIDDWKWNDEAKLIPVKRYIHIFDNKIFMGAGNFSVWQCNQLKRQIKKYMSLMSGLQQCSSVEDSNPAALAEFELLKKNIKVALNI